jgi:hypothetical protein
MSALFTVTGRDVLFAHWPVDPDALDRSLPDVFTPETFDGSAWVSALALETGPVGPGAPSSSLAPSPGSRSRAPPLDGVPQLNFRTYVTADGDDAVGVYFLSLDSARRTTAAAGRRLFGLPCHHASMRLTRRGDRITFQSHRRGRDTPTTVFQARYRPTGETYRADPGTLEALCVERSRYYFPATEDRRFDALRSPDEGVRVGRIEREPWALRPVEATIRRNTLFEAAGLPTPSAEPVVQYSPGFAMGVEPLETRDRRADADADPAVRP